MVKVKNVAMRAANCAANGTFPIVLVGAIVQMGQQLVGNLDNAFVFRLKLGVFLFKLG